MITDNTLATLISEAYGEGNSLSWLIGLFIKALEQNSKQIVMATDEYEEREKLSLETMNRLYAKLLKHEEKSANSVRPKKRK